MREIEFYEPTGCRVTGKLEVDKDDNGQPYVAVELKNNHNTSAISAYELRFILYDIFNEYYRTFFVVEMNQNICRKSTKRLEFYWPDKIPEFRAYHYLATIERIVYADSSYIYKCKDEGFLERFTRKVYYYDRSLLPPECAELDISINKVVEKFKAVKRWYPKIIIRKPDEAENSQTAIEQ